MNIFRYTIGVVLVSIQITATAQQIRGEIQPDVGGRVLKLYQARGADMISFDSTVVGDGGGFAFAKPVDATGYYQLAINDSDRVNIVLDRREPVVDLRFSGQPLEDHMEVRVSLENKRLQQLQYVMAETNAILASVRDQKAMLGVYDTLQLQALERVQQRALDTRAGFLDELAKDSASSYFARTYVVDRALGQTRGNGPMAVAAVFDFSDPELMRAAVYDQAIMAFLQNLNARKESQFVLASDTLMQLAKGNRETRAYMLEHLIDLFSTYGPEMALQHLLDRYVAPGDTTELPAHLMDKVRNLMALSVGRIAPDVELPGPGPQVTIGKLVGKNRYTALFFYSSTCEHCHAQLPGLKADWAAYKSKGFDVIGIALDVDSTDFRKTIRDNAIPWGSYSEFNGWGSKAARAYHVQGTPSFFLLDQQMKIVAKPRDAGELGEILEELFRDKKR